MRYNYRISICAKHCAYTELTNIETMKARNNNGTIEYQINSEWLSEEEIQNRCAITKNLCDDQKEWIETSNQLKEENARLRSDLKSVDEILEELEDYTHGAIGDKITVARIKLKP